MKNKILWGSASSAYQIEGAILEDGKGISIWDTFSNFPGNTYNNTNGNIACDHYHRYEQDIELMKEMGLETYRFSISWTRIFPNGKGKINQKGIDFYKNICKKLIENNIQPIITLYHWDLPQALQDEYQGWLNKQVVDDFVDYAKLCFKEFHPYVKIWIIMNEPNVFTQHGYLNELHPPKINNMHDYLTAFHHTVLAHAKTVLLFKRLNLEGIIGSSIAYTPTYCLSNHKLDQQALNQYQNENMNWFMESYFQGKYPIHVHQKFVSQIPIEELIIMKKASEVVDFIGINYYQSACISYDSEKGYKQIKDPSLEVTPWNWVIDPKGLTKSLKEIYAKYHLPILISENGLGNYDKLEDGKIHDHERIDYLRKHIIAIAEANVVVIAYCTWSFTDLLSWLNGYEKRYGFVYIDFDNDLKRIKKDSFEWYKQVIQSNGESL